MATIIGIVTLKATVRKAGSEAEKARAEAESMRIDNAEHATQILMDNIVKPLKDEFNETKKELARNTREMARLRKAIDAANRCEYHDDCPVLDRLRERQKDDGGNEAPGSGADGGGQHTPGSAHDTDGGGADVGGEAGDTG